MNASASSSPGVIVVAGRPLRELLCTPGIGWTVQERQQTIAAMWDALSGGRLDQHSRILVFSDSLMAGMPSADLELAQTARAIVAMSHARAHVFLAVWQPEELPHLERLIAEAAATQGLEAGAIRYHLLPVREGGRAVLDSMREVLADEVEFPAEYPASVDEPLPPDLLSVPTTWPAKPRPEGGLPPHDAFGHHGDGGAEVGLHGAAEPRDDAQESHPESDGATPDEAPADPYGEPTGEQAVDEAVDAVEIVDDAEGDTGVVDAAVLVDADVVVDADADAVEAGDREDVVDEPTPDGEMQSDQVEVREPDAAPVISPSLGRSALPPIRIDAQHLLPVGGGYPSAASVELLNQPKLPGQVTIAVTSSKGGSGKSTASILLGGSIAHATRAAGHPMSVCLVDLDTRDGQVASLIGKFMPTALNIRIQPVWHEPQIRRNLVHADGLGIDTLLAPIRPRTADTVGPDFYRTIIRSLQRMFDVVILDTSVQYLDPLIAQVALPEADEILFVTTLASTAVQGMARALREITAPLDESGLGIPREKIGILVNQSVANVGMEREQVLAAGLGVPVVGVIPLATKDVLTATNLNRMSALLDHPLIGPAYNQLARACLPGRVLSEWNSSVPV